MRQNPLKKIVELQKQGKNVGIYSVCSANGYVIEAAISRTNFLKSAGVIPVYPPF